MRTQSIFTIASLMIATLFVACAQTTKFKTVPPQEFQKLMNDKNIIILDVRTPEEVSEGKIPGAINIDYYSNTFEQQISKLDKSKTVMVYCRSGGRSAKASEILANKGFKVINLGGGIQSWLSQGLPIQN